MELIIENFQSIKKCSLEIPENSFTCIVGPSNIGKSAIRRALECVLYNKSDPSYIRKGESLCQITLKLDDGMTIVWSRDKKSSSYVIDGVPYTKLNKSVPEPILEKGFKELNVNKDKYSVQIASQFNNMFLLNQTGGKVTDALSNLGNLNRIISSNKLCLSDLKNSKSKLTVRREDLKLAKSKVDSYLGLDAQSKVIQVIKQKIKELEKLDSNKNILYSLNDKLKLSLSILQDMDPIKDIEVSGLDVDISIVKSLKILAKKLDKSKSILFHYKELNNLKEIALTFNIVDYIKARNLWASYQDSKIACENFENLAKISISEDLPKEGIDSLIYLKSMLSRLDDSKNKILSYREKIKDISNKLEELKIEDRALRDELKVCPLCDKEL